MPLLYFFFETHSGVQINVNNVNDNVKTQRPNGHSNAGNSRTNFHRDTMNGF